LTGDGGAGYHIMELDTAVRHRVAVIIVVLNNGGLAFEYHLQKHREHHVVPGVNEFGDCDYAAVARALGARGVSVDSRAGLEAALREALDASTPTLIDVRVDMEAVPPLRMYDQLNGARSSMI
jgi:acetolactate synthase-1/2/3 large subunit